MLRSITLQSSKLLPFRTARTHRRARLPAAVVFLCKMHLPVAQCAHKIFPNFQSKLKLIGTLSLFFLNHYGFDVSTIRCTFTKQCGSPDPGIFRDTRPLEPMRRRLRQRKTRLQFYGASISMSNVWKHFFAHGILGTYLKMAADVVGGA